jgi:hypothetical protein
MFFDKKRAGVLFRSLPHPRELHHHPDDIIMVINLLARQFVREAEKRPPQDCWTRGMILNKVKDLEIRAVKRPDVSHMCARIVGALDSPSYTAEICEEFLQSNHKEDKGA